MAHIEFCTNAEWLIGGLCSDLDVEHWQEEVNREYIDVAVRYAEDRGIECNRATGQRILFHGWNGAHFDERIGCFGIFGTISNAERKVLESADFLGYEAAEKLAERLMPDYLDD